MYRLSLCLLGPPRIEHDGLPVKVDTRKAIALLAYLAMTGESHTRDALVNLLWPEYDQARGRATLRRTLCVLRQALVDDWLDVGREHISLLPANGLWLDVKQFHQHLVACLSHGHPAAQGCPACLAPLTDAVALYRGDFLSGFSLKDSFNFDDWQFFQTDTLRSEFADALARLVACHAAEGTLEPAIGYARRWLALDRLDEQAHYQLMRLYASSGRRSAALRQYQECARILESQLGVAPQAATVELYQAIVAGRFPETPTSPRRQPAQSAAQQAARPEVLSPAGELAHRLTPSASANAQALPGVTAADQLAGAYQARGPLPQPAKARGIEGLRAELIGRDEELARLKGLLAQSCEGQGQMVSLIGEAGVGKSRLVAELEEAVLAHAGNDPMPLWLEGRCFELGTAVSYAPFIDILRARLAWGARDADSRRRARILLALQQMAARGDLAQALVPEMAVLLANLLSLSSAGDPSTERLKLEDREQFRWRTLAALRDFFFALARQRPLVLVLEDLHWGDSLSLDLVSLLMERLPGASLLLLCVYRPDREARCHHLAMIAQQKCPECYSELHLRELSQRQSRRLVESLLGSADIPAPAQELILAKAQGNPFFLEEVIHSLIDAGTVYRSGNAWQMRDEIPLLTIPERVQSVILSRVDRLEDSWRDVLQTAAVIGRVFRQRVLARAVDQEVALERVLWEIEDRALVYQERTIPEVEYAFKHVLTQEAVYGSIPLAGRVRLHQRVAAAIEGLYPDHLDEYCEQLAHHHEQAGNVTLAVAYLFQAGEKAKRSYANEAAIAHLGRALALLEGTPETLERARQELALLVVLGTLLVHGKGHAAPEVAATYARARSLCEQTGESAQLFLVLLGLRRFYYSRGELATALDLGQQLLAQAERDGDPSHLTRAHMMLGETFYWQGEFGLARRHCASGLAFHDPQHGRTHALLYGNDSGVGCRLFEALALWHLGYPDQALRSMQEMLALARELAHPFTLVFALQFTAVLHQLRREAAAAHERIAEALRICVERGFALYVAWGTIWSGWSLAAGSPGQPAGQAAAGLELLCQGIVALRATGAQMLLVSAHALLAEVYGWAGQTNEALDALREAFALVEKNGEHCLEAELYRVQGELMLLAEGKGQTAGPCLILPPSVEACFQHALDIAHRQGARSWELRAATSLSRLWRQQGRRAEARQLLQGIYDGFTEGFSTSDLQEARALLDALA